MELAGDDGGGAVYLKIGANNDGITSNSIAELTRCTMTNNIAAGICDW